MSKRGVNKVILLGNIGNEPKNAVLPNGSAVCNFSLATSEVWNDKQSGERQERTEWHRVVVFGKLAEIAGEYLHKGSQVYVEGQLRTRQWQDQDGTKRFATEVVADELQFVGKAASRPSAASDNQQPEGAPPFGDADIPF